MKQKQKHKNINISSFELQLIKNYYNFNKSNTTNVNTISFICYGNINVLDNNQRTFFNTFAKNNHISLNLKYLSSKSIHAPILYSSINSLKYIINSGIYQRSITFTGNNKLNAFNLKIETYLLFINKLNELNNLVSVEKTNITFNPLIILDNHSKSYIRSEKLKALISKKLNLQLRSYLIYLNNKKI